MCNILLHTKYVSHVIIEQLLVIHYMQWSNVAQCTNTSMQMTYEQTMEFSFIQIDFELAYSTQLDIDWMDTLPFFDSFAVNISPFLQPKADWQVSTRTPIQQKCPIKLGPSQLIKTHFSLVLQEYVSNSEALWITMKIHSRIRVEASQNKILSIPKRKIWLHWMCICTYI